jgi:DNA-binding HxlR family transcriptional regulator
MANTDNSVPWRWSRRVLAERWTLLVVLELLAGARRFNQIRRGVPRLSGTAYAHIPRPLHASRDES